MSGGFARWRERSSRWRNPQMSKTAYVRRSTRKWPVSSRPGRSASPATPGLLGYVRRHVWALWLALLLAAVVGLLEGIAPFLIGAIVDTLLGGVPAQIGRASCRERV